MITLNKIIPAVAGAIILIAVIFFGTYNSLVSRTTAIDGQWAQVETQYQRRFDLIPNLVNATKGYLKQEKGIFDDIANARTAYGGAKSVDEKIDKSVALDSALSRLLVIVENYPNLKSNETVAKLMDELSGTENRINVERRRYNELVQNYNRTVKSVPTNIVAGLSGFSEKAYFKAVSGSDQAPKVEL